MASNINNLAAVTSQLVSVTAQLHLLPTLPETQAGEELQNAVADIQAELRDVRHEIRLFLNNIEGYQEMNEVRMTKLEAR
jgi:vacuolar-type H+-ATPase subunit I/STV1